MKTKIEQATLPSSPSSFQYSKAKTLAAKIGVSPKTLHRWAEAGLISRRKMNAHTVLYSEQEVQAFVESAKVA